MRLERFFYHRVAGKPCKPTLYGKAVDEFPSIVDAKNFIYDTYKSGYTIDETDGDRIVLNSTNGLVSILCYFSY